MMVVMVMLLVMMVTAVMMVVMVVMMVTIFIQVESLPQPINSTLMQSPVPFRIGFNCNTLGVSASSSLSFIGIPLSIKFKTVDTPS
jgi:hypothetical protein